MRTRSWLDSSNRLHVFVQNRRRSLCLKSAPQDISISMLFGIPRQRRYWSHRTQLYPAKKRSRLSQKTECGVVLQMCVKFLFVCDFLFGKKAHPQITDVCVTLVKGCWCTFVQIFRHLRVLSLSACSSLQACLLTALKPIKICCVHRHQPRTHTHGTRWGIST